MRSWANAIRLLGRFSLVESDGESITMHRVVQAVIRDRLGHKKRPAYAAAALKMVNDADRIMACLATDLASVV